MKGVGVHLHKIYGLLLLLGLSLLYYKLIQEDPVLIRYDDRILLAPLEHLTSLQDYLLRVKMGQIFDVQPLRDFSLWLDLQAKNVLPFASFHFTNLLIWLGAILLVFVILIQLQLKRVVVYFATALYAFHPVFINSVAWISARKHLLSTFFIVIATSLILKVSRSQKKMPLNLVLGTVGLFSLACFSHPLNVFWPVFAGLYLFGHRTHSIRSYREKVLILSLGIVGVLCLYLNYRYYTGIYLIQTGGRGKFVDSDGQQLGIQLLAFGRYFFQMIIPGWPCVSSPYPGSPFNVVGLCLFPIFIMGLKKYGNRECFYWVLYFLLPLVPVLFKMTPIFASDTYLLNAGLGLLIAISILIDQWYFQWKNWQKVLISSVAGLVVLLFYIKSIQQSRAWESNFDLWENSYRTEATPLNTTEYGLSLLDEGRVETALEMALKAKEWNTKVHNLPLLFSKAVYLYPNWTVDQKIEFLEKNRLEAPWYSYFLAGLYASQANYSSAFSEMKVAMKNLDSFVISIADELELVLVETNAFCRYSKNTRCDETVQTVQKHLQTHPSIRLKAWNEAEYQARFAALDSAK